MVGESRPHVMADLGRDGRTGGSDGGGRNPRCMPGLREEAGGQPPIANRPTVPAGRSLLGVAGSLSTTSSPAAAATTSRLVHGRRNIGGREGAERATTVATPSWPRRPVAAPRNMLPTTAPRRVVGRCLVTARRSRDWSCRW